MIPLRLYPFYQLLGGLFLIHLLINKGILEQLPLALGRLWISTSRVCWDPRGSNERGIITIGRFEAMEHGVQISDACVILSAVKTQPLDCSGEKYRKIVCFLRCTRLLTEAR